MSKYKVIQTEFRNSQSLIKALNELGLAPVLSNNLKANSLTLDNSYGHQSKPVAIRVDRETLRKTGKAYYGGIGFFWNGKTYDLVADDLDLARGTEALANQIKQRYSLNEIRRQAAVKGYTVRETTDQGGTIRLTLVHH